MQLRTCCYQDLIWNFKEPDKPIPIGPYSRHPQRNWLNHCVAICLARVAALWPQINEQMSNMGLCCFPAWGRLYNGLHGKQTKHHICGGPPILAYTQDRSSRSQGKARKASFCCKSGARISTAPAYGWPNGGHNWSAIWKPGPVAPLFQLLVWEGFPLGSLRSPFWQL